MSQQDEVMLRFAREPDVAVIYGLTRELAEYEKMTDSLVATEQWMRDALFGPQPAAEVLLAETEQEVVGFALFYQNVSTFRGWRGLYIEDLFVRPAHRGRGIGKQLLRELARIANQRGWGMMEWRVLDWNEPAIEFYRTLGADPLDEWTTFRMAAAALEKLVRRGP